MTRLPKGHRSLFDPAFRYVPARRTDVAATFRRIRRENRLAETEARAIADEQARVVTPLAKARA